MQIEIDYLKEWRKGHENEHEKIWEKIDDGDEERRSLGNDVQALKTKLGSQAALGSIIGSVAGQIVTGIVLWLLLHKPGP